MILDTSALAAILFQEADADLFGAAMAGASALRLASPNLVEAAAVVGARTGSAGHVQLDRLLAKARVEIVPFTVEHAQLARSAYRDFGKGSGHPARLNLGDCFAYALAVATREPLLYKGRDFACTGIRSALTRD